MVTGPSYTSTENDYFISAKHQKSPPPLIEWQSIIVSQRMTAITWQSRPSFILQNEKLYWHLATFVVKRVASNKAKPILTVKTNKVTPLNNLAYNDFHDWSEMLFCWSPALLVENTRHMWGNVLCRSSIPQWVELDKLPLLLLGKQKCTGSSKVRYVKRTSHKQVCEKQGWMILQVC